MPTFATKRVKLFSILAVIGGLVLLPAARSQATNTIVRFQVSAGTNAVGNLDVELFDQDKPQTVQNFLIYFQSGAYTNTILHRSIPNFVLQGGGIRVANPRSPFAFQQASQLGNYGTITNEFNVGPLLSNVFGTIAMAKVDGDPDSATTEWFFNLGDNSTNLNVQNGGFTVFGRVVNSTNATSGTNLLNYFNTLSTNNGVVSTLVFDDNFQWKWFSDLPVNSLGSNSPACSNLFALRTSVLRGGNVDLLKPTIAITTPLLNARLSNSTFLATGTARDNLRVARVLSSLNGHEWLVANGTTNWTINLSGLFPGGNTLTVQSLDAVGRLSPPVSRNFNYILPAPFSLTLEGTGTVTGATNGQLLEVNRLYTVVAKPGVGHLFDRWTGGASTVNAAVSFYMRSNFSLTAHFYPIPPPTPLTLQTVGTGTVTGPTNGQLLAYLTTYTLVAKPGPGHIFGGWLGDQATLSPTIYLYKHTNVSQTATFMPNPFIPLAGTYRGLYGRTNPLSIKSSGALAFTLGTPGTYSGTIQYDLGTPQIRGTFNARGDSSIAGMFGLEGLLLKLKADVTNFSQTITGSLLTVSGTAPLELDRVIVHTATNPAPEKGRYTFVIPGFPDATNQPAGFGSGTVNVDLTGLAKISGTLGDGTPLAQSGVIAGEKNRWPLHARLYALRGKIMGWVNFNTNAPANFSGDLNWFKNTKLSDKIYRAGFSNAVTITGSPYAPPAAGTRALNWTNGTVILTGGNLPGPLTNQVTLGTNNVFTVTDGTNQLVLAITVTNGLVFGSFKHPAITLPVPLKGAVLQNTNAIFGSFVGTNQSGALFIGPAN